MQSLTKTLNCQFIFLILFLLFSKSAIGQIQNTCLTFDGIDDQITTNSNLLNDIGSCDFTFEAWVQVDPSANSINVPIFSNRSGSFSNLNGVLFFIHSGDNLALQLIGSPGSATNYLLANNGTYGATLKDGACHHVALSRKGDLLTFYIDGNSTGTLTLSSYKTVDGTASLFIGKDIVDNESFQGQISELKIWNTARSATEISKDMIETLPQERDQLQAYWRINEGANQTIFDYSDNTNNAYLGTSSSSENTDPAFGIDCCNNSELDSCLVSIVHNLNEIYSSPEVFETATFIKSKATSSAKYSAGNYILLEEGFEAPAGFEAIIEGCQTTLDNALSISSPQNGTILNSGNINFDWDLAMNSIDCLPQTISYNILVLDANASDLQTAISNNIIVSNSSFTLIPSADQVYNAILSNLVDNNVYIWKVSFVDDCGNLIESDWNSFVKVNNSVPEELMDLSTENICEADCQNILGSQFKSNSSSYWNVNSGSPVFDFTSPGCEEEGFVSLSADSIQQDIISTVLVDPIMQDKHYQVQLCLRTSSSDLRVKVVAYNGNPSSFSASSDVAIISYTGHIPATPGGVWSTANLPIWTANKDFNNIAIMLVNDDNSLSNVMDIDNVCLSEMPDNPCLPDYDFSIDFLGNISYPSWLNDLISNFNITVKETETEIVSGSIVDLYGHNNDVTLSNWYDDNNPPCHSIGNIPPDTLAMDSMFALVSDSIDLDTVLIDTLMAYGRSYVTGQNQDSIVNGGTAAQFNPVTPILGSNSCLYFDGVDDVIATNIITNSLSIPSSTHEFLEDNWTFEFTFEADATQFSNSPTLISNLLATTSSDPTFPITTYTGFRIFFYDDGSSPFKTLAFEFVNPGSPIGAAPTIFSIPNNGTAGNILDNTTHTISLVRDGNDLYVYIDGNNESVFLLPSTNLLGFPQSVSIKNSTPLRIGNDLVNNAFKGIIRDVRIWNKSLQGSDILSPAQDERKRYSFLEDKLLANFELYNLSDQVIHNNAGRYYANNLQIHNEFFHNATLGLSDIVSTDDPSPVLSCLTVCNTFSVDNSRPFGGRDIVFVHGLNLRHLCDEFDPSLTVFNGTWPDDEDEFYEGDFQNAVFSTWRDHIDRELGGLNSPPSNNYMVLSYNCAQRLADGINSIASQIKEGIETGRNVVWANNPQDCKQKFGNEIVIISQSTGALVSSSFLGLAGTTDPVSPHYDSSIQTTHGDLHEVSSNIKLHVSTAGALIGSPHSNFAFGLAYVSSIGLFSPGLNLLTGNNPTTSFGNVLASISMPCEGCYGSNGVLNSVGNQMLNILRKSVLIDLKPDVAEELWATGFYHKASVPTITVAGHYSGLPETIGTGCNVSTVSLAEGLVSKYIIVPGPDDGVVTADCSCGRVPVSLSGNFYKPSTFESHSYVWKNYDLGNQSLFKSLGYWKEMSDPSDRNYKNNTCISGRTSSGMLTWMKNPSLRPSWGNHYSFIQGNFYHYEPWNVDPYGYDGFNSRSNDIANYEESLVITNSQVYSLGLVSPTINNDMEETIKQKTVGLHLPWVWFQNGWPRFEWKYFEFVIWRRKYHNLKDGPSNDVISRVYEYVLR